MGQQFARKVQDAKPNDTLLKESLGEYLRDHLTVKDNSSLSKRLRQKILDAIQLEINNPDLWMISVDIGIELSFVESPKEIE